MIRFFFTLIVLTLFQTCVAQKQYQLIIRQGNIYDGSGAQSFVADLAIDADTIAVIGDLSTAKGKTEIDAKGLAVSPGFINMLSWADGTLLDDGRGGKRYKAGRHAGGFW